jgi:DNA topoisomerase-1
MTKYLVIVESPTKSRTIHKFLGKSYQILSSMGHVVDLPKSKMGVDIANGFKPSYIVIAKRRKLLSELKKGAKGKDKIYLAMDPDREGEAIAYHLKNQLETVTPNVSRVTFHEITERAIKEAFKKPHRIDANMVNAQQARRILDRILGYSLSPLLWKKVGRGLSAGRVQSVALRLVVEREKKIKAFVPEEYWEIEALLRKKEGDLKKFKAKLISVEGKDPQLKKEKEAHHLKEELEKEEYIVKKIKGTKRRKRPSPPYITSTLQQDAFNKLGFSVSRTMKIAQELYEGIELGKKEATGLITYVQS